LATAARAEKESFDHQPRMLWFYQAIAHPGRGEEHQQLSYLEQLKRWHETATESCIPAIASAWVWLDMAESLRAGASRPLGDEGLSLFRQRVERAETFLSATEKLDQRDVEYYAAQTEAVSIEKWPDDKIDDVMDEGLQLDPNYSKIYLARVPYLSPRYGGKEGDFGRLASTIKKRLGGREGELAFAQIALTALADKPSRYRSNEFNAEELGTSLVAFCRERASQSYQVQLVCRLAYEAGDFETARMAFDLLPPGDCDSRLGPNAQQMESWRAEVIAQAKTKKHEQRADGNRTAEGKLGDKKSDEKPGDAKKPGTANGKTPDGNAPAGVKPVGR
jgi:hypothetical protein